MRRLVVVSAAVLFSATACGSAHRLAAPSARHNVLVYAAPAGPCCDLSNKPERIMLASANGSHRRFLANGDDPAVSPDGRYVAYDTPQGVLLIPTSGGAPRTVANGGSPSWAPNSRFLGFVGGSSRVVVEDVTTGKTVTSIPYDGDSFAFSPDSQRIAYVRHGDLYVVPTGRGGSVRLTNDHKSGGPVWGKSGIAFIRFTHDATADIWLSDGTKHSVRQLTHVGGDIWPAFFSEDGKELLAANPAMHNGRLWAVDVTTGVQRPITPWIGDLYAQGLSADGKTVLASIGCGGRIGPYGVVETIPYAGGKPQIIVHGPCRASWNR